jgi:hypothetical protein
MRLLCYLCVFHPPYSCQSTARQTKWKSKLPYDWRFTANQFVLASGPLRPTTWHFFFQLKSCGNSPYVTSSLTRRWVCLLWMCLAFHHVYISHIYHITEYFLLQYIQVLFQYSLYRADHAYLTLGKYFPAAANTNATIELLDAVLSMRFVSYQISHKDYYREGSVKKISGHGCSRGFTPRRTDWR